MNGDSEKANELTLSKDNLQSKKSLVLSNIKYYLA
jgi:hypothetical protein